MSHAIDISRIIKVIFKNCPKKIGKRTPLTVKNSLIIFSGQPVYPHTTGLMNSEGWGQSLKELSLYTYTTSKNTQNHLNDNTGRSVIGIKISIWKWNNTDEATVIYYGCSYYQIHTLKGNEKTQYEEVQQAFLVHSRFSQK